MKSRKSKRLKAIYQNIFIVFFISMIAISAISYLSSLFYFNKVVKEKFILNFKKSNKNKYKLSIEKLNINLLRSYILLKNVKIELVNKSDQLIWIESIHVPIIEITQVHLIELINHDSLKVNQFKLELPEINLLHLKDFQCKTNEDSTVIQQKSQEDYVKDISVEKFEIQNANIKLKSAKTTEISFSLDNISLSVDSLNLRGNIDSYFKNIKSIDDLMLIIQELSLKKIKYN